MYSENWKNLFFSDSLTHSEATNYFYDTSVIFSNFIITYRSDLICIGHDRRTDVIGIDFRKYPKRSLKTISYDERQDVRIKDVLPWFIKTDIQWICFF